MKERVLAVVSQFYQVKAGHELDASKLYLVSEELVEQSAGVVSVKRDSLIEYVKADSFLESFFEGGPSWIHFHQYAFQDGVVLVTVRRGNLIGADLPSINTSYIVADRIRWIE